MNGLELLVRWLERGDEPRTADAIFVLDGGEAGNHISTGLNLLNRGYAPVLVVSHSLYYEHSSQGEMQAEAEARAFPDKVRWLYHEAVSTGGEAQEARRLLKSLGCSSVLVVTSSYHTRRTRMLFRRELSGIQVRVVAAPLPVVEGVAWARSREGRSVISFEAFKLVAAWLHLDPSISIPLRLALKERAHQFIYWLQPAVERVETVSSGELAIEALDQVDLSRLSDDEYMTAFAARAARSRLEGKKGLAAGLTAGQPSSQKLTRDAQPGFRAVTIVVNEAEGQGALVRAFNAWVEKEQPVTLIHVHYYHDPAGRSFGYQIIYEEAAAASEKGEEPAQAA